MFRCYLTYLPWMLSVSREFLFVVPCNWCFCCDFNWKLQYCLFLSTPNNSPVRSIYKRNWSERRCKGWGIHEQPPRSGRSYRRYFTAHGSICDTHSMLFVFYAGKASLAQTRYIFLHFLLKLRNWKIMSWHCCFSEWQAMMSGTASSSEASSHVSLGALKSSKDSGLCGP